VSVSGILVLDKPRGPSSHQVTAWVRDILGTPAGHSGTLDPMVSGVLVVMLGRAVRLAPVLLREDKEYVALMRLHSNRSHEEIERVAAEFVGKVYQRPPRRSAVRRSLRIRTIHELEILEVSGRLVLLRVRCESGTYIRSLCHHLGLALGTGAQMQELRRTRSGTFGEEEAHTLHDLMDACVLAREGEPEALEEMILPVERAILTIPKVVIGDRAVDAICHGAALAGVGVISREPHRKGDLVALLTQRGQLVALGEARVSSESYAPGDPGLVVSPRAVLMEPGTYPRGWIKRS
jgi:predicted rRNA pseudouridine synthase